MCVCVCVCVCHIHHHTQGGKTGKRIEADQKLLNFYIKRFDNILIKTWVYPELMMTVAKE